MEVRTHLLLCLLLSIALQATAGSFSGSGSGSGSGANNPPCIDNCPMSVITEMVAPEFNVFSVNISVLLTASDSEMDNIDFVTNVSAVVLTGVSALSDENFITNATIDEDGSYLILMIDGMVLNPVTSPISEFNVSIYASDGMESSDPCEVSIQLEYLEASECQAVSVNPVRQQAASSTIAREMSSVTVPLQVVTFDAMAQAAFTVALASFITESCSNDCGSCELPDNCPTQLQLCAPFTSENVIISEINTVSDARKRQSLINIEVVTYISFPDNLPTTGNTLLLPPEVIITTLTINAAEFQNVTGIILAGTPTLLFESPVNVIPFDFAEIAVIVLSVLVPILVLSLLAGIAIVLLVVYIIKKKKQGKIVPVSHDDSRQSSVGKGHMNVVTV